MQNENESIAKRPTLKASPEAENFIRAALDSGLASDGGCVSRLCHRSTHVLDSERCLEFSMHAGFIQFGFDTFDYSSSLPTRSSGGGNLTDDISSLHGHAAIAMCVTASFCVATCCCCCYCRYRCRDLNITQRCRQLTEPLSCKCRSTYGDGILVAIGPHPESTHRHLKLSKAVGEKPFRRLVQRAVLVAAGVLT